MRTSILQKFASLVRQRNSLDRQIERLTGFALESRGAAEWLAGELFGLAFSGHVAAWPDGGGPVQTLWVRREDDLPSPGGGRAGTQWLLFLARSRDRLPSPGEPRAPWQVEEAYLVPDGELPGPDWAEYRLSPPDSGCRLELSAEQAEALLRLSTDHSPALER
ncbi:MAG: hypothetical protein Q3997_05105 [Propionibacteriaceae bacterium]|nr:hypothetical protein [Propionibacteriaceae bacterium]